MFTTYFPFLVSLGIPALIAVPFAVWVWRARRPCPSVLRTTMTEEQTFYQDLDKPNGLFQL